MRDFVGKRSTAWGRDEQAAAAGSVPGKRTLTEMLPTARTDAPVQRSTSGAASAMPDGPRPTIEDLFGRVQPRATIGGAEPDAAATHASALRGIATPASLAAAPGVLPEPVRGPAERIVGTDLADVRIREGSAPAALGALAYTQGNDVVFAPGCYNTSSSAGLELLGHELAHVAQQRAGAIQGVQAKHGGVNLDHGLEQAADNAGRRLASAVPATPQRAEALEATQPAAEAIIQAKFGFELEAKNNKITQVEAKEAVYKDDAVKVEADSGHSIEFVAEPQNTIEDLKGTVKHVRELATRLANSTQRPHVQPEGFDRTPDAMGLEVSDKAWNVSPQHTVGVSLEDMPAYLRNRSARLLSPQNTRGGTAQQSLFESATAPEQDERRQRQDERRQRQDERRQRQIEALATLIIYYLRCFNNSNIATQPEGPKGILEFMTRNSFYDLYHSIDGANEKKTQDAMRKAVNDRKGYLNRDHQKVFPHGYTIDDRSIHKDKTALTIDSWIDTIFNGMQRLSRDQNPTLEKVDTDAVSPPYPQHHRTQVRKNETKNVYAMGAYPMDQLGATPLALIEQRGQVSLELMEEGTVEEWLDLVAKDLLEASSEHERSSSEEDPADDDLPVEELSEVREVSEEDVSGEKELHEVNEKDVSGEEECEVSEEDVSGEEDLGHLSSVEGPPERSDASKRKPSMGTDEDASEPPEAEPDPLVRGRFKKFRTQQ